MKIFEIGKIAVSLIDRDKRKSLLSLVALVIFMATFETIGIASILPFVSVLSNPDILTEDSLVKKLFIWTSIYGVDSVDKFLIGLGLLSLLLLTLITIFRSCVHFYINKFVQERQHELSVRILITLLGKDYTFFSSVNTSELGKAVLAEAAAIVNYVYQPLVFIIAYGAIVISVFLLLIFVNPLITLVSILTLIVIYGVIYTKLLKILAKIGEERVSSNKNRFFLVNEIFDNIKYIKFKNLEDFCVEKYYSPSEKFARSASIHQTLNIIPSFVIEYIIFGFLILSVIFIIISGGGINNTLFHELVPSFALFSLAAFRLKPALHNIYQSLGNMKVGSATLENVIAILGDVNQQSMKPSTSVLAPSIGLSLKNISHSFDGFYYVLENVNMFIPAGSNVGIMGSTGSGKSTLLDIIMGLVKATAGTVLLDGKIIEESNSKSLQNISSYVPQQVTLWDTSIAGNIALGLKEEDVDYSKIREVIQVACLERFISQLNDGLKSSVGQNGVKISGGQKQRIGIARALYTNPSILVLDEATSALDLITEKNVLLNIREKYPLTTVVQVAHRLSALEACDLIYKIDDGSVSLFDGKLDA